MESQNDQPQSGQLYTQNEKGHTQGVSELQCLAASVRGGSRICPGPECHQAGNWLERVFAKLFLGKLDGHKAKHPKSLSLLLSGSYDGEIKLCDVPNKECVQSVMCHSGYVRGIVFSNDGSRFFTIGDDKVINVGFCTSSTIQLRLPCWRPAAAIVASFSTTSKSKALAKYRHNPETQPAGMESDAGFLLHRGQQGIQAVHFRHASFEESAEDSRRAHIGRFTCIDYALTGWEFVSGSYDKTIRIFNAHKANSREVYHTKRMQHVTCVG